MQSYKNEKSAAGEIFELCNTPDPANSLKVLQETHYFFLLSLYWSLPSEEINKAEASTKKAKKLIKKVDAIHRSCQVK